MLNIFYFKLYFTANFTVTMLLYLKLNTKVFQAFFENHQTTDTVTGNFTFKIQNDQKKSDQLLFGRSAAMRLTKTAHHMVP